MFDTSAHIFFTCVSVLLRSYAVNIKQGFVFQSNSRGGLLALTIVSLNLHKKLKRQLKDILRGAKKDAIYKTVENILKDRDLVRPILKYAKEDESNNAWGCKT